MKATGVGRTILIAGVVILFCLACTNSYFDNVKKLVDDNTNGLAGPPTFTPPPGSYSSDQSIAISSATPGAAIFYTTDGSTPTASSPVYSGPILVAGPAATTTIRAFARKTGYLDSVVVSATYVVNSSQVSTPTFSPLAGSYGADQSVSITCATVGAAIHFTTDGTTPTAGSPLYSAPIPVIGNGTSMTIKAMATRSLMVDSPVGSALYTINYSQATSPNFFPPPGTYFSPMTVVISSPTPGAVIRYTTDGSTPTSTFGTVYSSAVFVGVGTTIKAIAYAAGFSDSTVSSSAYTFSASPPVFSPSAGTYTGAQSVNISTTTPGAAIHYTTDGSTPTSTVGTVYGGPVNVTANTTLRAIAYEAGWTDSPVMAAAYSIMAAMPTISPTGGRLGHAVPVSLFCTTPGATIVYTIDGSFPTESGGVIQNGISYTVTGPFTLPYGNTTVVAMAFLVGMADSAQAVGIFNEPVFVYVGSGAGSSVTALQVNLTNGMPTPVGTYGVGAQVQTVAADPAGRYLFSSANLLATTNSFAIDPPTGGLTAVNNVAMGNTFVTATVDATGQYLYSSTSATNGVTGYTINQSTGAVTQIATFSATGNTAGVAADPVAPYLYVALSSTGQVQAFSINTATGSISSIGVFTSAIGTYSVVVDPTGKFLFAGNQSGGLVTAFKINPDGTLIANGQQSSGNPIAVAIDPTGRFLYAADYNGGRIYGFAVNQVSGVLTPLAGLPLSDTGGTSPVSLTVEPSGKYLYVAHGTSTSISIYQIDSLTGSLSFVGTYSVGATQTSITSTGVAQ